MKRTAVTIRPEEFPPALRPLFSGTRVYDSSCSRAARVWFLERDGGLYLKRAPGGTLKDEAEMTRFFHEKGLGAQVLDYRSGEYDWLLTRALPGEDCTHPAYLSDPRRLCDTLAQQLRRLHETDVSGCPIVDRTARYVSAAARCQDAGRFDLTLASSAPLFASPEEAWHFAAEHSPFLQTDTLLHGDYCLPNIMLDDWRFSGFLDLDTGGVGDRHIDLFWGSWTLFFNLKTDAFCRRFLDAYGRDRVDETLLRTVAALSVFA